MELALDPSMCATDLNDRAAANSLFDTLYSELHRLARRELARQGPIKGLSATTLLHDAYLAISGRAGTLFLERPQFLAYAGRVMRGLIIDEIRRRQSQKRGGAFELTPLIADVADTVSGTPEAERIGDALDELGEIDPDLAEIVDLKFFCGFSFVEIAAMRGVSERTVQRAWEKARLYLHRAIKKEPAAA
jgi:RNA polymerase sigma factor (TIGR02999 family)